jgi:hypothetical protein
VRQDVHEQPHGHVDIRDQRSACLKRHARMVPAQPDAEAAQLA